jgi:hypothetical protein
MPISSIIRRLFGPQPEPVKTRPEASSARQWISNPWHAVSVIPCRDACGAARQANRVRFLSKEAPVLPLPGCSARNCDCRYRHHQDRRNTLRRQSDLMASKRHWTGKERRGAMGRRDTDRL